MRGPRTSGRRGLIGAGAGLAGSLLTGCAARERPAVPRGQAARATALGLPNERFYFLQGADGVDREFLAAQERQRARLGLAAATGRPANFLAVSGGGEDGAFGAGLLCAWTEMGTRPEFDLVTGVSTGALTAPFAFLGPRYDGALREVYTSIGLRDVASMRDYLSAVLSDALADTGPLHRTISRYLTAEMLADIAAAHEDGRLLLIGTTNLDAQVPVVWNIGAIAGSGHPRALDLVRRILLASASIPGVFPPVMLDVTLDGHAYQEMHVDGGAFAQSFLYPRAVGLARAERRQRGVPVRDVRAWIIRNAKFEPEWASVNRRIFGIFGRTIDTMIFTSGFNDVIRMYQATQRDDVAFHLAYIGPDFTTEWKGPFETAYMRALFHYGYERGRQGHAWVDHPPDSHTPPAAIRGGEPS